jgi:hypothetical protein
MIQGKRLRSKCDGREKSENGRGTGGIVSTKGKFIKGKNEGGRGLMEIWLRIWISKWSD